MWLWAWFGFGMVIYMLKRAYFLVKGPNPVARTYREFLEKCWIPLLVRAVVDSGIFWATFYPEIFNPIVAKFGLSWQLHSPMSVMPEPVALFVGLGIDSVVDFAVTKIPFVKDWLPQMPPPLMPNGRNGGLDQH
jgi:hypothetical protein